MKTQFIDTLKINKLSQKQYERELAAGRIDKNAIYVTPEENGSEQVATLTIPLNDYYEGPYYDEYGMEQWGKLPRIGGQVVTERMLLLETNDYDNGRTENALLSQFRQIFNARLVCISVFAYDCTGLATPHIYKETVGSTMTWGGYIGDYSVTQLPTDTYAEDVTHTIWGDNVYSINPGEFAHGEYLKLSKGLFNAIFTALNCMDNTPEEPVLVFTAYN